MTSSSHLEYEINNDPEAAYLMIKLKSLEKAFIKISNLNLKDASGSVSLLRTSIYTHRLKPLLALVFGLILLLPKLCIFKSDTLPFCSSINLFYG